MHQPLILPHRYRVTSRLGEGGYGVVLEAHDLQLDRRVAIKVLRPSLEPGHRARFLREAQVLAGLDHPHLVRVFDVDLGHEPPLIVTELLPGEDLSTARPEDPLECMLEVAEGLDAIHQAGVLHRDVKPENVLVGPDQRAVLIDLGLATGEDLETLTATGMMVGTPSFLAPELFAGRPASAASDWYAWGATLYFALEGRLRVGRRDFLAAAGRIDLPAWIAGHPLVFRRHHVASPPARLAQDCMHSDPAQRPRGVTELRRRLREYRAAQAGAAAGVAPPAAASPGPATLAATAAARRGGSRRTRAAPRSETAAARRGALRPAPRAAALALRGALAALVLGLGVALAVRTGPRASARPPGPRLPLDPLVELLGPDPAGALQRDLDEGMRRRLDLAGRPVEAAAPEGAAGEGAASEEATGGAATSEGPTGEAPGRPFLDALDVVGVAALDALPAQRRVLDWVAAGGDLGTLSAASVEALRRLDRALVDLGAPPTFAPFLDVAPVAELTIAIGEPAPAVRLGRAAAGLDDPRALGWARAARMHLRDAFRAQDRLRPRLDELRVLHARGAVALLTGGARNEDRGAALTLRASAAGRGHLRELVREGQRALRLYLVAARRFLDLCPEEGLWRRVEDHVEAFERCQVLFTSAMISAGRDRLFGPPAQGLGGQVFEAFAMAPVRLMGDRSQVDTRPLWQDEVRSLERALAALGGRRRPRLVAECVRRLLQRWDLDGRSEARLVELYRRHHADLAYLRSTKRPAIAEIASSRGLAPLPPAAPGVR